MKIYYASISDRYMSNQAVIIASSKVEGAKLAGDEFGEYDLEEIGTANPDQEAQVVLRDYWHA